MTFLHEKEEFLNYSLENWKAVTAPYDGQDSNEALLNFLDWSVIDNREFLLYTTNPLSHLHECWVFWQFVTAALGFYSCSHVIFAGHWRNIYRVHHVAKKIGAITLTELLQEGIDFLDTVPIELIEEYEKNDLSEAVKVGRTTQNMADEISKYLEFYYDAVVQEGVFDTNIGFEVKGNGKYPTLDALASYLETLRLGGEMAPLKSCKEESQEIIEYFKPFRQKKKLISYYESLGHKKIDWLIDIRFGIDDTFLKVLADLGEIVIDMPYRGKIESIVESFLPMKCIVTKSNKRFVILEYLDGRILVDLESQEEIFRQTFEGDNPSAHHRKPMLLRDRPAIYVEPSDFTLKFLKYRGLFRKKIKYLR